MFDIVISLMIEIIALIFFSILGMIFIPKFSDSKNALDNKIVSFVLSPVLGFALWIGVSGFFSMAFPFNKTATYILLSLMIILIIILRNKLIYFYEVFTLKKIYIYLVLIVLSSIAIINTILPAIIDGGLYFHIVDYDHARVAIVNSIMRNGFPIVSPFVTHNGELVNCSYHIGIHIVMAQLSFIFNVKTLISEAVVYGLSYISTFLFCIVIIYKFSKRKIAFLFMVLLFFSIVGFDRYIFFENIDKYGSVLFGFFSIFNSIIWNTHHILAAVISLLIIVLYVDLIIRCDKSFINYALIGILASASSMISIYSGTFSLILFILIILIMYCANENFRSNFNKIFLYQIFSVFVAVICVIPYLHSLISYTTTNAKTISECLKLMIYKHDSNNILLSFIKFYFYKLPIKLGIAYVLGFIMVLYLIIKLIKNKGCIFDTREFNDEVSVKVNDLFLKLCAYYVVISFAIIFIIRSDFYTNDFGWRIVMCSEIIQLFFSVILSIKIYDFIKIKSKILKYMFLLIYIAISLFYMQGMGNFMRLVCVENPSLHKEFANAIKGWDVVKAHTKDRDIVLCNPEAYKELYNDKQMVKSDGFGVNIFYTHYGSRNSLIADYNYSRTTAENIVGAEYIKDLYDFAVKFFEGNPTKEDVEYICDVQNVKAILVTPQDGLYKNEGNLGLKYPNKIEGKDYVVYLTE